MGVHNFVDSNAIQKGNMKYKNSEKVSVKVTNGVVVDSEGKVAKVSFSIHGLEFESEAYVISLVGCDMVLGVS